MTIGNLAAQSAPLLAAWDQLSSTVRTAGMTGQMPGGFAPHLQLDAVTEQALQIQVGAMVLTAGDSLMDLLLLQPPK